MLPLIFVRLANAVGKPIGINPFPRAFANPCAHGDRRIAFDAIYNSSVWNSEESLSGPGSEISRTRAYGKELARCLDRLHCKIFFDAPCGDLNWILPAVGRHKYIGGDIARSLIADIQQSHPDLDLRTFDICDDRFPEADVWHCRDCLFHLPFADIEKALRNFVDSDIPYALLTTHRSRILHRNLDIPAGGWRYLDLEMPPFSLPTPIAYLRDFRLFVDFPRYVGLWTRAQIESAVGSTSA